MANTTTLLLIPLSISTLREWATTKDPNLVLGAGCTSGGCPVARYLREMGYQNPHVSRFHLTYTLADDPILIDEDVPYEVRAVTKAIDQQFATHPVIAAQFIEVLDQVEGALYARSGA
jgi:hypothetical protein